MSGAVVPSADNVLEGLTICKRATKSEGFTGSLGRPFFDDTVRPAVTEFVPAVVDVVRAAVTEFVPAVVDVVRAAVTEFVLAGVDVAVLAGVTDRKLPGFCGGEGAALGVKVLTNPSMLMI